MSIFKYLVESLYITENTNIEYPDGFDITELNNIKSFSGKIKYVDQHLEKIGTGSSRVVYKISDSYVLKLAKNAKGLAQNSVEGDWSMSRYYPEFVLELIDKDENNIWLIIERAKKITKSEFFKISGYKFEEFSNMIQKFVNDRTSNKKYPWAVDAEKYAEFIDDEFIQELGDFIINYDLEVGDIGGSISNWGASTKHTDNPVLVDVGLSKSVHQNYYNKQK